MAKKSKTTKKATKKTAKKAVKKSSKKVAKTTMKKASKKTAAKKSAAKKKTAKKSSKKTTVAKKSASSAKATVKKTANKTTDKAVSAPSYAGLKVGQTVPNFSLPSSNGGEFQLKDLQGKKVVLYFYPKDSTPGCTIQGIEFSGDIEKFKAANAEVFGISRDTLKSHANFIAKQNLKIDLLSDEDETACNLFDVIKEKNMYGNMVMGIERSTFLIDEQGKLIKEWRKVKAEGHAAEVLEVIKS